MTRDPRLPALEILGRIERLRRFQTLPLANLQSGSDDRDVLERCIEVISEASRRLPEEAKRRHPEVNWRGVADIGNVLRHGYDRVSVKLIGEILAHDIDALKRAVEAILADLDPE